MNPRDLASEWREKAKEFHQHALDAVAAAYGRCADQLEEALEEDSSALLDLQQAAQESGYSADHLGRLVREGRIPNSGRAGAPRIARRDLPRKASEVAQPRRRRETTNRQVVQSIIAKESRNGSHD